MCIRDRIRTTKFFTSLTVYMMHFNYNEWSFAYLCASHYTWQHTASKTLFSTTARHNNKVLRLFDSASHAFQFCLFQHIAAHHKQHTFDQRFINRFEIPRLCEVLQVSGHLGNSVNKCQHEYSFAADHIWTCNNVSVWMLTADNVHCECDRLGH